MAKKAASKAASPKAATAAPAPAEKAAKKAAPRPKAATKSEVYTALAEKTELSKKQIAGVFDSLNELIVKELGKKGPRLFVIPGLLKLKVVRKKATKARQGVNPATKEPITIKAQPARDVIKAVPLKSLKESI